MVIKPFQLQRPLVSEKKSVKFRSISKMSILNQIKQIHWIMHSRGAQFSFVEPLIQGTKHYNSIN